MDQLLLGIDIGTTSTKSVLLHPTRGIIAEASAPSTLYASRPGWAEANTSEWWDNVRSTIRNLLKTEDVTSSDIVGIAATGMVPAVVAVDKNLKPQRNAILQNDARAVSQIDRLRLALAAVDLVAVTGSALTQQSVAPTALWLRENEPETWANTRFIMGSYDWLLAALGAEPHVERNWAIESGLFTLSGDLIDSVLAAGDIPRTLIPPVLAPGQVAGHLSVKAADETGLRVGIPLVVGGADHVLSAYSAGVAAPGSWLVKLGGAGDILVASQTPVADERIYLDAHPIPKLWLPNGCMATSGSLIRWFQNLVGGVELTQLDSEAQQKAPGELLCLPYFLGEKSPLQDTELRGAFIGLGLGHDRADMYRSVLEAIAFGFRHNAEVFEDLGLQMTRAMITNGGSRSKLWKQIHSEVLGTEMWPVKAHPGASLGAAIAAGVGTGILRGWDSADDYLVLDEPVVPDPRHVDAYNESYREWRALGLALTDISHTLARRTRHD